MGEMSYEEEIITGSLTRRILAQTLCFVFLGKWGGKFVKKVHHIRVDSSSAHAQVHISAAQKGGNFSAIT